MSTKRLIAAFVIVAGSVTGCASGPMVPVYGSWRIQSYASPGLSAQSPVQSLAWVGVSARFAADDARVGGARCYTPKYTPRTLSAAEFQQEYKATTTALGLTTDPVTVYNLECGTEWGGQTNVLIVRSPTSLLTPWAGAFFELVKTEPRFK